MTNKWTPTKKRILWEFHLNNDRYSDSIQWLVCIKMLISQTWTQWCYITWLQSELLHSNLQLRNVCHIPYSPMVTFMIASVTRTPLFLALVPHIFIMQAAGIGLYHSVTICQIPCIRKYDYNVDSQFMKGARLLFPSSLGLVTCICMEVKQDGCTI